MWDIPTNFTKKDIHDVTSKFGPIASITLSHRGPHLTAIITYQEQNDYEKVNLEWSLTYKETCMRIFPFYRTHETKEIRNTYRATLINLPPNTNVSNLAEIITQLKAKSCYIPLDNNNQPKRLAQLTFENESDLNTAKNTTQFLNNTPLEWTNLTTKLCHICSSRNHQVTNCPDKNSFINNNNFRTNQLYPSKQNFKSRFSTHSLPPN